MHPTPLLAIADYWVAGILTMVAAAIVTTVILISSRSDTGGQ
ncbi:MAG: hypothetical protein PVF87_03325 [Acidimicrobiia bacterium]